MHECVSVVVSSVSQATCTLRALANYYLRSVAVHIRLRRTVVVE
jgi:hypothetical protein